MKIFISWSKPRSKEIAEALKAWLPQVIQAIEPWISVDIEKGQRWNPEISSKLEEAKIGIICLTQENVNEPWILFEAGALSKNKDAHVCTFLFDLRHSDVVGPLSTFQHTQFNKDDVKKLMSTINNAVKKNGQPCLPDSTFDKMFDTFWPEIEAKLQAITKNSHANSRPARKDRDILEEILETVRNQERTLRWLQIERRDRQTHFKKNRNEEHRIHDERLDPPTEHCSECDERLTCSEYNDYIERQKRKLPGGIILNKKNFQNKEGNCL